jgi:hypothetical protein
LPLIAAISSSSFFRRVRLWPRNWMTPSEPPAEGTCSMYSLSAGNCSGRCGRAGDWRLLSEVGDGPLRAQVPSRGRIRAAPGGREVVRAGGGGRGALAPVGVRRRSSLGVGGLLDAVDDGATRHLIPPGDVGALRAALQQLADDPHLRAPRPGRAPPSDRDAVLGGGHRRPPQGIGSRGRLTASAARTRRCRRVAPVIETATNNARSVNSQARQRS